MDQEIINQSNDEGDVNSECPLLLVKCMKRRYAEQFVNEGVIHFGSPGDWIAAEMRYGIGRGDAREGVTCALGEGDDASFLPEDFESFVYHGLRYYRNPRVRRIPCCCFYGVHLSDFCNVSVDKLGDEHKYLSIPANYFTDFGDSVTKDEYVSIPSDSQPVAVLIFNPRELLSRIAKAACEEGILVGSQIGANVSYYDMGRPFMIDAPFPAELFAKDNIFSQQKEFRVIFDVLPSAAEHLLGAASGNLKVGCLSDIAKVEEGYYFNNLCMEFDGTQLLYALSVPKTQSLGTMDEMSIEELLSAYVMLSKFCLRYDSKENTESLKAFEQMILQRCNAERIYYDAKQNKVFIDGREGEMLDNVIFG